MSARAGWYQLHCRSRDGGSVVLHYSPSTSELTDEAGTPLLRDRELVAFDDAEPISPSTPGWKSNEVRTLKIQLGMRCNYSCSYCNQASSTADEVVTRTDDATAFLVGLDRWLHGTPERIEFWGGEPLLYFAKLAKLVPALRARFPHAAFAMVSNGSLLSEKVLSFLETWDIGMMVSHDGPGQHLRGPDPFDDPTNAYWLRRLWRERGRARGRVAFNVVLTPANADIEATRSWIAGCVEDENVALDTEGAVSVYDDSTLHGSGRWRQEDYAVLHNAIVAGFRSGAAFRYASIKDKAQDFILSLRQGRPATTLGQKCRMDRPDELAVDLLGNVMTCQNTGARGEHRIGHVDALQEVALDTALHWSNRETCRHCPVLQLCKGGCMFLRGEHFAQTCENEYRYNLAVLAGVIDVVAGLQLDHIAGDIRRPTSHRTIPIRAA